MLRKVVSILSLGAVFLTGALEGFAGSATNITGLYYTGVNNSGGLLGGGSTDSHWSVTYARADGINDNNAYQGAAYVVNPTTVQDSGWASNTASAQWITAPGADNSSGTPNVGGNFLPGNGTTGTNTAQYIYTLSFYIAGKAGDIIGSAVTNKISISLTIAADDQYSIYVNPVNNLNGSINTTFSNLAASGTSAWGNTTANFLQNFTDANGNDNADFVIGTNKISILVNNTNSSTGSSTAVATNASGLLVYQVGSAVTIDGKPVPEVGTWLPLVAAVGLYGAMTLRRKRRTA